MIIPDHSQLMVNIMTGMSMHPGVFLELACLAEEEPVSPITFANLQVPCTERLRSPGREAGMGAAACTMDGLEVW